VSRLIRAIIDTSALRGNLEIVRRRTPGSKVMAVVKANAYGHGLVPTALALADADAFAVARLEEGLALRAAGVTQPIVLLEGVFSHEQLLEAARHGFDLVVHDPLQVQLLESEMCPYAMNQQAGNGASGFVQPQATAVSGLASVVDVSAAGGYLAGSWTFDSTGRWPS